MVDRTNILIHVPQFHDFEIERAETIRLVLPTEAMASRTSFVATPDLVIYLLGSASISGDLGLSGSDETSLRQSTHTLDLALDGNAYLSVLTNTTHPDQQRVSEELLTGCSSPIAPPNGWNAQMRALGASATSLLSVLSPTLLRITLPPMPAYATDEPETVRCTLPASTVISQQPLYAGTFVVLADAGSASLSGSLLAAAEEGTLQGHASELVVTLDADTWVPSLVTDPVLARELVEGMRGDGGGTSAGWDRVVQPVLHVANLRLASPTRLVVSVPPSGSAYQIETPETVTVLLPGAALTSGRAITTATPLIVGADAGTADLQLDHSYVYNLGFSYGSELSITETALQQDATTVYLFLSGDRWADLTNATEDLAYGFASTQTIGWNCPTSTASCPRCASGAISATRTASCGSASRPTRHTALQRPRRSR